GGRRPARRCHAGRASPHCARRAAAHATVGAEASDRRQRMMPGMSAMPSNAMFAEVAALAGDLARAAMLHALMDGRALTASELARGAGVTPQAAGGHLARMTTAGLIGVEKQGRHRYHRLASPAVAQMVESIMQVASGLAPPRPTLSVGPRDAALRAARTCYDHLAGHLGVALADALVAGGHAQPAGDPGAGPPARLKVPAPLGIAG